MPVHPAVRLRRHSLPYRSATRLTLHWQGLLADERHSRSLRQRARAPHGRVFRRAMVSGAAGPCSIPFGGARQGPDRRLIVGRSSGRSRTAVQQRRPGRVSLDLLYRGVFIIAAHRAFVSGCEGPTGIAELRSVASRVAS